MEIFDAHLAVADYSLTLRVPMVPYTIVVGGQGRMRRRGCLSTAPPSWRMIWQVAEIYWQRPGRSRRS